MCVIFHKFLDFSDMYNVYQYRLVRLLILLFIIRELILLHRQCTLMYENNSLLAISYARFDRYLRINGVFMCMVGIRQRKIKRKNDVLLPIRHHGVFMAFRTR